MSFDYTEADITRFRNLTTTQKKNVIKQVFGNDTTDDTKLTARLQAFADDVDICRHKKQKIKNALVALGL